MSDFERVERYIVIKRKDITLFQEGLIRDLLSDEGIDTREAVVAESHHPHYEETWENVQRWAEGRPTIGQERDAVIERLTRLWPDMDANAVEDMAQELADEAENLRHQAEKSPMTEHVNPFHGCQHHGDDYDACIQHSGTAPCGVTKERDEYHSHLTVIAEMTGDAGDIGAAWESVNALQEALVASEKREQALAKTLERCRAAHANGKDMYYGVVEQYQESDIQASQAGMRLRKAEEQRDALAAHVERLEEAGEDLALEACSVSQASIEWSRVLNSAPKNSLARRDLIKQAEALEEAADQLPNSHPVAIGLRNQAAELRRQAEGGE